MFFSHLLLTSYITCIGARPKRVFEGEGKFFGGQDSGIERGQKWMRIEDVFYIQQTSCCVG